MTRVPKPSLMMLVTGYKRSFEMIKNRIALRRISIGCRFPQRLTQIEVKHLTTLIETKCFPQNINCVTNPALSSQHARKPLCDQFAARVSLKRLL